MLIEITFGFITLSRWTKQRKSGCLKGIPNFQNRFLINKPKIFEPYAKFGYDQVCLGQPVLLNSFAGAPRRLLSRSILNDWALAMLHTLFSNESA